MGSRWPHSISEPTPLCTTGPPDRMSPRKWRATKQQPSRAMSAGHQKEGSLQLRCNWGPRIKRISLQYHMSHHAPSDPKPWLLFQANTYTQWVVQYCVHRCGSGPYIACDSPISRLTVWREHTCRLVIGLRSFRHYPGSESNPRPCDCKTCALTD